MSMLALGISSCIIILWSLLAIIARKTVDKFFENNFIKELFYEAIAAAELCASCFELIIVADNFGVGAYAIFLFLLTIWWGKVWNNATACPYTHMEDLIQGNSTIREVGLKIWAQLMGGCCIYRLVQILWWFEFIHTHEGRAFENCSADLKVSPYLGAFIEGIATLLCRLASKSLAETNLKHINVFDSFIGTSLVVIAFNYSGGYFNPVLATALKWGCDGHTRLEHIIVYWIGSCFGALLSIPLFKMPAVREFLIGENEKNVKIE